MLLPGPVVRLDDAEAEHAALIAFRRQISNLRAGRRDQAGAQPDRGWDYHVTGALGEAAVAKWAGLPWDGCLGDFGADDVGRLQVRARARAGDDLIIQPGDKAGRCYILVVPAAGVLAFRLAGWVAGRDAKQARWWGDPHRTGRPAYWVPQAGLRPVTSPVLLLAETAAMA